MDLFEVDRCIKRKTPVMYNGMLCHPVARLRWRNGHILRDVLKPRDVYAGTVAYAPVENVKVVMNDDR